ncbi:hypothetical protein PUMCH_004840 [Australozyma saopauloensis]|uniref:Geranylgeranyl transferase type-2 subunit alpha n=1 Tax=Australozyma saopauloensis TaxID=291208 RepID=A0AAX4HFS9_9ASCO|nr:hypothetical protein PUMCH_004840 [[Candida] saopauloensis]
MLKGMLREFPKCYWIWNHRRWCLEDLSKDHIADWKYELGLVLKVLEMDSRNFHGWHYRRYVVWSIERELLEAQGDAKKLQMSSLKLYLAEYVYATSKIKKNISNFSAWHSRSKLIPKIMILTSGVNDMGDLGEYAETVQLFKSPLKLLNYELDLVKTGMFMDAADTSVWLFMRWLLTDDIFVNELKKSSGDTYLQILEQQLSNVTELNELEKEDSPLQHDNVGCVKMIVFIRALINKQREKALLDKEVIESLNLLTELDPLRKGHYLDQINGLSPLTC